MKFNRNKNFFLTILVFLVLTSVFFVTRETSAIQVELEEVKIESEDSLILPKLLPPLTDSPFSITVLADFTTYASNPSAEGLTVEDRFIIEDYYINATGYQYGINVNDTARYFEIRNCVIFGGEYGIWFDSVYSNKGILYNNTILESTYGCMFTSTHNHLIHFNEIYGATAGIFTSGNDHFMFYNNTIHDCSSGIYSQSATQSNIEDNVIYDCDIGIDIDGDYNDWIVNNTVSNCSDYGIYDQYSDTVHIDENNLYNNFRGIEVYSSIDNQVTWNNVYDSVEYGISLRYTEETDVWHNHLYNDGFNIFDTNITRVGTLVFQNFNNYLNDKIVHLTVNGQAIAYQNQELGQLIFYNCSSVLIDNCTFPTGTISSIAFFYSDLVGIWNCDFFNQYVPVVIDTGIDFTIDHCSFNNSDYAILAGSSTNIDIWNSTFGENIIGVYFQYTDLSVIQRNTFYNNTNYGISLGYSDNNMIYHNNFIENGPGSFPQCSDFYGTGNLWYSLVLSEGNYWSDWVSGDYLIHCEFDDIYDLYPLNEQIIIISEFQNVSTLLAIVSLMSIISAVYITHRRK
jgi:parallel beta-helix repeat protein